MPESPRYDLFADDNEAARDHAGVTHVVDVVGEDVVAMCGEAFPGLAALREDVDCMTCIVLRDRLIKVTRLL
jgi:hypothetical protein